MTPVDFWRSWWSSWFAMCQHQFALQEEMMAMAFPAAAANMPKMSSLCGVAPTSRVAQIAPLGRRASA